MRGRFIAFEGGEGCGKSTQARLLAEWLEGRDIGTELTREPGGTPGAEAIRTLLLHPPGAGWGAPAEALLFAAARADHVAQLIHPTLEKGRWVVCDRFVDSSRAYQGGAGGVGDEAVRTLHEIGSGGLLPDLTILLDVDAETAIERTSTRDRGVSDAIGGRGEDYHRTVRATFATLAREEPGRFALVDGNGAPGAVHERVRRAVEPLLDMAR